MDDIVRDPQLAADRYSNGVDKGERVIRAILLTGFLAVLMIELWLLWQWLQLLA